jgi:hypothetical protein
MGYYMTIAGHDLKYKKHISTRINEYLANNEFYLPWNYRDGHMDLDEGHFKWSNEFIKDLLVLKNFRVRGHLICHGEEGEYLKYEINDQCVKEYCGSVVFSEKPEKVIKSEDDIKKLEF